MGAVGVVLVGGRSSRMGTAKACLEWHGSTLLARTVRIVQRAIDGPVVVVRAPGQALPTLPTDIEVVEDDQEGLGPMQGLAVGLDATRDRGEVAFVCSTDLPFLHPVFVSSVLGAFGSSDDAVVPHANGHRQPLAAGYRTSLAETVAGLLASGSRKPAMILEACQTRWLDEDALLAVPRLAEVDPALDSVRNINTPDDYEAARAEPPPPIDVQCFGTLAGNGEHGLRTIAAATLAEAAAAAEVTLDQHVVAALNGERITRDPDLPLVRGDRVAFLSADAGG